MVNYSYTHTGEIGSNSTSRAKTFHTPFSLKRDVTSALHLHNPVRLETTSILPPPPPCLGKLNHQQIPNKLPLAMSIHRKKLEQPFR